MSFFLGHCSLPYKLQARTLTITYSNNSEICTHIYHFLSIKKQRYKKAVHTHTSELRSCVKVEVAILGSPSLISLMVSVDVKLHETHTHTHTHTHTQLVTSKTKNHRCFQCGHIMPSFSVSSTPENYTCTTFKVMLISKLHVWLFN